MDCLKFECQMSETFPKIQTEHYHYYQLSADDNNHLL